MQVVDARYWFVTDLAGMQFAEGAETDPIQIEVCRDGVWQHPWYDEIRINAEVRESFQRNFEANVRRVGELPLDYDHREGPAPGWIVGLQQEENRLLANVRLTPAGRRAIQEQEYRFFSPEWAPNWVDPESQISYGPTLFGGALTNRPFFRGMEAVSCGEIRDAGALPVVEGNRMQVGSGVLEATPTQEFAELQSRLQTLEAERQQEQERRVAVELEVTQLRMAEVRRGLDSTLETLRFGERGPALAPACRPALRDALLRLGDEDRAVVLAAVSALRFAELGERGWSQPEGGEETLSAAEERMVQETAKAAGLDPDSFRRTFVANRRKGGNG
ncbi:MAG: hypothetical protein FJX77_02205 [Armatimonadetes bacterium]|nr:hypothetical protein [Armatimonadota bacterium]